MWKHFLLNNFLQKSAFGGENIPFHLKFQIYPIIMRVNSIVFSLLSRYFPEKWSHDNHRLIGVHNFPISTVARCPTFQLHTRMHLPSPKLNPFLFQKLKKVNSFHSSLHGIIIPAKGWRRKKKKKKRQQESPKYVYEGRMGQLRLLERYCMLARGSE